MNKVAIGLFLFLSFLGCVLSAIYAFVVVGMGGSTNEPIERLFMGLFVSIPIILAIISVYLFTLLLRSTSPSSNRKNRRWLILAFVVFVLFFTVFWRAALSALSILFN